ncbi:MAG: hypothetical protein PHV85_10430 [Desulfovibrionaceae bacterium]|nr:hypothetical protein [Desulfovibrionaceae bacterium]MDD4952953.1 hypothetical protein [Desulfovibrionaceae bacterium]
MNEWLGELLDKWRQQWRAWRVIMFAVLACLVGLNFVFHPHEPHFGYDKYTGFWAIFGLGVGLVMVIVMKKIIQPMIARDEDFYDR